MLRPLLSEAFIRVERVRLREVSGEASLLAHLIGQGDHSLAYRSEDVVIYRNNDVLPRAYALPAYSVEVHGETLTTPEALSASDVLPVEILRYEDQFVTLRANLEEEGYLIFADLDYPGWQATVDGVQVPILVADEVFRAVMFPSGEHEVVFSYHPWFVFWRLGLTMR
ncbi:MAG: hypothetical protein A2Y73_04210 [Chloroflexi bacterium RBG_13_56_8]|nr:MAG: hypothetical protein A2Y73_04210 [Chloroflexi bacterium RBG_13_56_8]